MSAKDNYQTSDDEQMQRLLTLIILTGWALCMTAAKLQDGTHRIRYKDGPAFIYRVCLTDKEGTPYSIDHPSRFLSRRAIERRKRQGLAVDSTDLPVSPRYIHQINKKGISIIGQSRWQNTILVRMKDSTLIDSIRPTPSRLKREAAITRNSKLTTALPTRYTVRLMNRYTI